METIFEPRPGQGELSNENSWTTDNGRTHLSILATRGPEREVTRVLDAGANVNHEDYGKRTPLSYAAEYRRNRLVNILLAAGAHVDSKDTFGRTPLVWAAASDAPAVVRTLLQAGADINDDSCDGRTALSFAAEAGAPQVVQILLEHGAANLRDCVRESALLSADNSGFKHVKAVTSLLRKPLFESQETKDQTEFERKIFERDWRTKRGWDFVFEDDECPLFFCLSGDEISATELADFRIMHQNCGPWERFSRCATISRKPQRYLEMENGRVIPIRNPDLLDLNDEEKELRKRWVELCSFIYESSTTVSCIV